VAEAGVGDGADGEARSLIGVDAKGAVGLAVGAHASRSVSAAAEGISGVVVGVAAVAEAVAVDALVGRALVFLVFFVRHNQVKYLGKVGRLTLFPQAPQLLASFRISALHGHLPVHR